MDIYATQPRERQSSLAVNWRVIFYPILPREIGLFAACGQPLVSGEVQAWDQLMNPQIESGVVVTN